MKKAIALAALMALAACHRPRADQPTPGADGEAQAATAAKTNADLQAADEASQGPAPDIAPARAPHEAAKKKVEAPVAEAVPADDTAAPTVGNTQ